MVFIAGCAVGATAGRLAIPAANAAGGTNWEYLFVEAKAKGDGFDPRIHKAKAAGDVGWELVQSVDQTLIFKKRK